jgi:protein-disulfide isomerase
MPPTPKKPPAVPNPGKPRNTKLLLALAGAAALVVALVVGAIVVSGGDSSGNSSGEAASAFLTGVPQKGVVLGKDGANVTLIQFEDPQCPICKRYQEEGFPDIVDEYVKTGKIKIRYAGLRFIGDDSQKALLRIIAAAKQNKGFQFSEELYARQGPENSGWVTDELLADNAASPEVEQEAAEMTAEASRLGVQGTPWFFIQIGDAAPYEVQPQSFGIESFRPIFDDALKG